MADPWTGSNSKATEESPQAGEGESRTERLWGRVEEKLSNSTVTGLSEIFTAGKLKYKLYWSILLFIGVICFAYNLYEITERFVRAPLLTQLETGHTPFTWPHLTFCNPSNPIPFWNSPGIEAEWQKLFKKADTLTDKKFPKYGTPNHEKSLWPHYLATSSVNPDRYYKNGIRGFVNKVLFTFVESSIASSSMSIDRFHKVSEFEKLFRSNLYSVRSPIPCYTFSPQKLAEAYGVNIEHMLKIKLYLLLDLKSYEAYDPGFQSRKLYFFITQPNATVEGAPPNYIYTGTDSQFAISESLHQRYRDCTKKKFNVELYSFNMERTEKFVGGYEDCLFYISQEIFQKECGCMNPHLPIYKINNDFPKVCLNMTLFSREQLEKNIKCMNGLLATKSLKSFKMMHHKKCLEYKKPTCFSRTYTVIRNSNTWRSEMSKTRKLLWGMESRNLPNAKKIKNVTDSFGFSNLAILILDRSKKPPVFTFEELEYPTSQYISDIGGIAGLWLGLSIISLFEITELAYVFYKYVRSKK